MKCVLDDKVDCPLDLTDLTEYGKQMLEAIELIAGMMPNSMTGYEACDSCAEVWDLTDLELVNDQVRELFHTESLDGSPDWDDFILYTFHQNVEDRITLHNLRRVDECPRCYECPKQPHHQVKGCPAFLSQIEFADKQGVKIDG